MTNCLNFDVVIVGAGPAGLAAAIRIKQSNSAISVIVLEKGGAVGAHILSGAVVDPIGVDCLLPEWQSSQDHPFKTAVTQEDFFFLRPLRGMRVPNFLFPSSLKNHDCFILSLGKLCSWLASHAERLGVEIVTGFAGVDFLFDEKGSVCGVRTGSMGLQKDSSQGVGFVPGVDVTGKYILLAEGARGSLTKKAIETYGLAQGRSPQKYGLGLKELWRVKKEKHKQGLVQHFVGWPLDPKTGGGGFVYHLEDTLVSVGFIVHLDYKNPTLSPFEEFQRFKTHPYVRKTFEEGTRLSYGARTLQEGGWQSVPKLCFPGGVLIGCAAGFVNIARIKGSHNAILSGIAAADSVVKALNFGRKQDELFDFEESWRIGKIGKDLWPVRNFKPLWSRFGTYRGLALGFFDLWCNYKFSWSIFGTLSHKQADFSALEPFKQHKKIAYAPPDYVLTFDRASSLFLSGVYHEENQPTHLHIKDENLQKKSEYGVFGGASSFYCPAGVYEWLYRQGEPYLTIHPQNCIHCKTCDIKDPNQNIEWVPPQGGEGPFYSDM